jgi:predicted dehydrogenase
VAIEEILERPPPRIRLGMIGGGEGAFIGAVHRIAARLDDRYELVAGALASTPEKARRSAAALGLAPERSYADFHEMLAAEVTRPDGIEIAAIVTPNHLHAPAALACLKARVHVICDKPLTTALSKALELRAAATASNRIFAVTYNYSGYPLVRHAREMIAAGKLGDLRLVQVQYAQDWLTETLEATGQKQADWRTDPTRSGAGGCIGDIGTHAFQLAHFVVGVQPQSLLADLSTFVAGRRVDDNAQVLLRYGNGARGALWASQVAPGNENNLTLRVYGSKGGIEWRQEHPNQLSWTPFGAPTCIITRGTKDVNAAGARVTRIPAGHPEGYLEAFATIYSEVAAAIVARRSGVDSGANVLFPGIDDGVAGVAFVDAAIRSSREGGVWVTLDAM